ncbi:MAG: hypothetical protein WBV94_32225 [Blastocatellia bacterium]
MSNLLVRDVPEQIRSWIEQVRSEHRMTQQEFVLKFGNAVEPKAA